MMGISVIMQHYIALQSVLLPIMPQILHEDVNYALMDAIIVQMQLIVFHVMKAIFLATIFVSNNAQQLSPSIMVLHV